MKRAMKRTVSRGYDADTDGWVVDGNEGLGDSRRNYMVHFDGETKKYVCTCYSSDYGRTRARKMCSHVLAVILYRRNRSGEDGEGSETTSHSVQPGIEQSSGVLTGGRRNPSSSEQSSDQQELSVMPATADKGPAQENAQAVPAPALPSLPTPADLDYLNVKLPEWVSELRPHQWDAVEEIQDAYNDGTGLVWLDGPTGSGKTLIAELARRVVKKRMLYICSSKTLQDQFVKDFSYSRVLKGRSNYIPLDPAEDVTCSDCDKESVGDDDFDCTFCSPVWECPYEVAKRSALEAQVAVINTAYMMSEANYVGGFSNRDLTVVDECDVLEGELMNFVSYQVTESVLRRLKLTAPKKGSHYATISRWLEDELQPALKKRAKELRGQGSLLGRDLTTVRQVNALVRLQQETTTVLTRGMNDGWVRDNDAGPLVLKPIRVDQFGTGMLWRHSRKWLCMSATIVSPQELEESLGVRDEMSTRLVSVPMTFPVENRIIHAIPVANMVNREKEKAWPLMVEGINAVLQRHPGERTLVHSVSYALTQAIVRGVKGRPVFSYRNSGEREHTIRTYLETPGAVLVAPSLDRGVDFKGDQCRVIIIAKVPYPYLGDKQVSARMNGPGGKLWYAVQTVRSLVQMSGRGVRSKDDWCVTYILDSQFRKRVWKENKSLFPGWWREAVDTRLTRRELLNGPQ
jgi:Rad3-related DNA helicase